MVRIRTFGCEADKEQKVRIRTFGCEADKEQYALLLERAQAVQKQFGQQVTVEEHDPWGEVAAALGIAGSPALAVDDDVVCVRCVPSARHLIHAVERRLGRAHRVGPADNER